MNVQIISSPTLDILDYGVGLPGSQHDATAWQLTRIIEEHHIWLGEGEWVWADTAYPLDDWVITPYKRPEKLQVDNATFNYWVSRVRVRSEHCIGFLKGRFNSLRGLRIQINSQRNLAFASLWIVACIVVHNFALKRERAGGTDFDSDDFFAEGLRIIREEQDSGWE